MMPYIGRAVKRISCGFIYKGKLSHRGVRGSGFRKSVSRLNGVRIMLFRSPFVNRHIGGTSNSNDEAIAFEDFVKDLKRNGKI